MNLHDIHRGVRKHKKRKRLGRGPGSGQGKTGGRGHKGAGSARRGYSMHPTFEGGQMPLARRIPKRGFHNRWEQTIRTINVSDLEKWCEAGQDVTPEALRTQGRVRGRYDMLKVLGDGELTKKLNVSAHQFSQSALEKIEKAGGKAIVIETRVAEASAAPAETEQ